MGKRMLCMVLVLSMLCGAVGIEAKAVVDHSFGTEYDFNYIERDGFYYSVSTNSEITGNEIKLTGENAQKIKSIGSLEASNEDSFFYGNLRSAVTLDLTECTNLETINDFVGFNKTKHIVIKAPTSLKRVGKNVLNIDGKIQTTNINLVCGSDARIIECDKTNARVMFNTNCDSYVGLKKDTEYWANKTWNVFADADDLAQFSSQSKLEKVPERDFHTFDGFYCGDKKIFDKDGNQVDVLFSHDTTILDAHWIKGKINATLKNSLNNAVSSKQLTYGDSISSISVPDWEGRRYTFTNWKLDGSALSFPFTPHDNLTLTAEFSDNVYNVKFMGETETEVKDIVHTHNKYNGDTVDGDIVDFANYPNNKKGYKLEGWGKSKNTVDYTPTDKKKDLTDIGKTLKLYPKMSPIEYTVEFLSLDKRDYGMMSQIQAEYDKPLTLPDCDLSRDGFDFLGWSTKIVPPGNNTTEDVMYKDGQTVINLATEDKEIVYLYPVWKGKTYRIFYDQDEGEITDAVCPIEYVCGTEVELPKEVKKEGYTFDGWYLLGKGITNKISSDMVGDIKLTAMWKKVEKEEKETKIKSITKKGVKYELSKNTVVVKKVSNKKSITIASSVKMNGKTYKVTAIVKNALKSSKKIKKLTIKVKNITKIQKNAFLGMSKNSIIKLVGTKKKRKSVKKLIIASGFPKKRIK